MIVNYWWQLVLLVVSSYFIGNFCAAIFISTRFIQRDIRSMGSKNPGTTNMTRVFGIKYGAATLIIDCLKGFVCAFGGRAIFTLMGGAEIGLFAGFLAGLALILGHNYPVLHGFRGGKGFASGIGVFLGVTPVFTLWLLLAGIIVLLIVDRMSVCALAFFTAQALYHMAVYPREYWWGPLFALGYLILSVISHWPNILRLSRGEEKPLGIINKIRNKKQPT